MIFYESRISDPFVAVSGYDPIDKDDWKELREQAFAIFYGWA